MQPQTDQQNQQYNPSVSPPPTPKPLVTAVTPVQQTNQTEPSVGPVNTQTINTPVVKPLAALADSPQAVTPAIQKVSLLDKLPHLLFFYGFASIFLINFVNAVVDPKNFITLLTSNALVPSFSLPIHLSI